MSISQINNISPQAEAQVDGREPLLAGVFA
jgi:hypothetical protein